MSTKSDITTKSGTLAVSARALLMELRPKQWTKNAFVFAGLVFSLHLVDPLAVGKTLAAFLIFCAVSSSTYIINDLFDLERDRIHPTKRFRPIASGALSPTAAKVAVVVLLAISLPIAALLSWMFALVAIVYFCVVLLYSVRLKHMVLLDVFAIASGFVLRAVAGPAVLHVTLSSWLLVCAVLLSLFLAIAKRRHELVMLGEGAGEHRKILDEYSQPFLDQLIGIVTSATIIAYSLYTFSATNLPEDRSMMITIPIVLYALFRYLYLIYQRNEGGSPETLLMKDKPLIVTILLWGVAVLLILYRPWLP